MSTTIKWRLLADPADFTGGTKTASAGLKQLDKDVESNTLKAAKFAGGVDQVSKKLAGLGEAAGLPASQLRVLSDVGDVAQIGLENLSKGAVGFNSASLGAAGAGLALGTAIGTWLNTFPAVQHGVDALRDSIMSFVGAEDLAASRMQAMSGIGAFQNQMAKSNQEAVDRQVASLKKHGLSIEEIDKFYQKHEPTARTAIDHLHEEAEAHRKSEAAAKLHAAEVKRVADAWTAMVKPFKDLTASAQRSDLDVKLMAALEALGPLSQASVNDVDRVADSLRKMGAAGEDAARDLTNAFKASTGISIIGGKNNFGDLLKDVPRMAAEAVKGSKDVFVDLSRPVSTAFKDGMKDAFLQAPALLLDVIRSGGGFGAAGGALGGVIGQSLQKPITDALSGTLGKTLSGALGALAPGLGSLLGGLAGKLLGGLFGGGEEKQVNDIRDRALAAAGGWEKLHQALAAAGNEGLMQKIFDAKTIAGFNAAMGEANALLGLRSQAQNDLNAAAEKYGFVTQNQIDMQAGELLKSWELLNAAQFDNSAITQKMSGDLNDYFQKAIAAGHSIPANFEPIAKKMLEMGLLTDASGNAVDSLAAAGITGFGAMTDGVKALVEEIRKLVAALRGVPESLPDYSGGGGARSAPADFERSARSGAGGGVSTTWGEPWMLHGTPAAPEYVLTTEQMRAMQSGGGGGGGRPQVIVQIGPQEIRDFIVREVRNGNMPGLG